VSVGAQWVEQVADLVREAVEQLPDAATDERRQILAGVAAGLGTVRNQVLVDHFAGPTLTPVIADDGLDSAEDWDGLQPAQKRAVEACCAPGLQLIWGPPGIGTSRVIATAVSYLARTGRRVLLLSSTLPAGLDQTLRRLDAVAVHRAAGDELSLARRIEARQTEPARERAALELRIRGLTSANKTLTAARADVAGFDPGEYEQASRRVAARAAYERQQQDLRPAEVRHNLAVDEQVRCQYLMLALACREAGEREQRARAQLTVVDAELAELRKHSWTRMKHSRAISRLLTSRLDLIDELARARSALGHARNEARQAGIAEDSCGDQTRAELEAAHDSATGRLQAATTRLADVRRELARLGRLDLATPADDALVTDQWRLWQLHNTLPTLEERAAQERRQRAPIEREHEQLQLRIAAERRELEPAIVASAQVVATTLTQIALQPWITATPFDYVIVDQAAAARLPQLVQAVGQARLGAVLIGDHLHNGLIKDGEIAGRDQVRTLFSTDCFEFFQATKLANARTKPGCVVLADDAPATRL
jgi:hypothetical protein